MNFYTLPPGGGRPPDRALRVLALLFLPAPSVRREMLCKAASRISFTLFLPAPSVRRETAKMHKVSFVPFCAYTKIIVIAPLSKGFFCIAKFFTSAMRRFLMRKSANVPENICSIAVRTTVTEEYRLEPTLGCGQRVRPWLCMCFQGNKTASHLFVGQSSAQALL